MSRIDRFKVVDEDGNEYKATCEFRKENAAYFFGGPQGQDEELLPECWLEDGRSITKIEEGVFKVTETEERLYVKKG